MGPALAFWAHHRRSRLEFLSTCTTFLTKALQAAHYPLENYTWQPRIHQHSAAPALSTLLSAVWDVVQGLCFSSRPRLRTGTQPVTGTHVRRNIRGGNNAKSQAGARAVAEQKVPLTRENLEGKTEEVEKSFFYKDFWNLSKFSKANGKTF